MIEVKRGDELGEPYRRGITDVLVRGFAEDFAYFSGDPRTLVDTFAHMVLLDRFYVAVVDGEPAAIASVTEGAQECFAPRWDEFRQHLGPVHGTTSYLIVRSQFLGAYDTTSTSCATSRTRTLPPWACTASSASRSPHAVRSGSRDGRVSPTTSP
jgi:hypothetical protein